MRDGYRTAFDVTLVVVLLYALVHCSTADAVTFTEPHTPGIKWIMCDGPGDSVKFRQPAGTTDLVISCANSSTNLTLKGCVGPRVRKITDQSGERYVISCNALIIPPQ